jgi:hypothetical protein
MDRYLLMTRPVVMTLAEIILFSSGYDSAKTCLRGKTSPRLGHIAPASEFAGRLILPF